MSNTQLLGWTLLHSLWQGMLIAIMCGALFTLLRSPRARHAIGCAGLLAMLAGPIATFFLLSSERSPPVAARPMMTRSETVSFAFPSPLPDLPINLPSRTWREIATDLVPWLARCWIGGIVLIAAWHLVGFAQLSRLRRRSSALDDADWMARLRRLSDRLEIKRRVELLISDRIDCPAVLGFFKPAILWPAAALTGLTPTQIDALLAHELAHVCRHDAAINLLQVIIETLLFYHPCVWWLSKRVRQERENCCDDLAAQVLGDRVEYAGALVAMESLRHSNTFALQANGGSLMKRIKRLLEPTTPRIRRTRGVHGALIVIALLVAASFWNGKTNAAEAEATTKPTTTQPIDDLDRVDLPKTLHFGIDLLLTEQSRLRNIIRHARSMKQPPEKYSAAETRLTELEGILTDIPTLMKDPKFSDPAAQVERGKSTLVGECYLGGHIPRPGVYSLYGTKRILLREMIATAGGVDENASLPQPLYVAIVLKVLMNDKRTESEIFFLLDDIVAGKHDDIFLMPDDFIMVGVNPPSSQPASRPAK